MRLYDIELEPEVRAWLDSLGDREYGRVMAYAELLAEEAETLGEPYARHLGGKVRELRFPLRRQQLRISYWLAPGRRVVLLTVFGKTRRTEAAEVARAMRAQKECAASHGPAETTYDRGGVR
ncbi:MAG: type II toxin-antitoxin system RelE/ParE family toxin [Streptosporangiaceae bacterium]